MKVGYTILPVTKLIKASWNYKYNDAVLMQKLKENIKENGQIENMIVREISPDVFEVVNGNHRLDILLDLKIKQAHCFNLGKISDNKAKRIAIETNETKFPVDSMKLSDILKNLIKEYSIEELAITMPYSATELESLMKVDVEVKDLDFSNDETTNTKTKEQPLIQSFYCPKCGFKYDTLTKQQVTADEDSSVNS